MLTIQRNNGYVIEASWSDADSVHVELDGVELHFDDVSFEKQSHPAIPPKAVLADGIELSDATERGRGVTIKVDKNIATARVEDDKIILTSAQDPDYAPPTPSSFRGVSVQSLYREKAGAMEQSLRDDAWLKRND